jgi:hypothetical protein
VKIPKFLRIQVKRFRKGMRLARKRQRKQGSTGDKTKSLLSNSGGSLFYPSLFKLSGNGLLCLTISSPHFVVPTGLNRTFRKFLPTTTRTLTTPLCI